MSYPPPAHVGISCDDLFMAANHEQSPHGLSNTVGWYYAPTLSQGMHPDMSQIGWWPGPNFPAWQAIVPWWVAYVGASGSGSTNTAVEIAGVQLCAHRTSTQQWEVLWQSLQSSWILSLNEDAVTSGDPAPWSGTGPAGGTAVQPGNTYASAQQCIHGGGGRVALPWGAAGMDFDALHVIVRHRLVLKNPVGVDDRASANFIVQAGADYYPTLTTTLGMMAPAAYVPGVGVGRFLQSQNGWRLSTFLCRSAALQTLINGAPPAIPYT